MPMTKSQKRIYDFIAEEREANRPSPTLAEITDHFKLTSTGAAQLIVNSMIAHGYITHVKKTSRSFICVPQK